MGKLKKYVASTDSWAVMAQGSGSDGGGGTGTTFATDFYGTMSADFTHNSSGNWLSVPFDTATRDTNSEFNTTSDLWVCKDTGTYVIASTIRWKANATGNRGMAVSINGDSTMAGDEIMDMRLTAGTANRTVVNVCMPIALTATDTVGIYGYQSSGGSLDVATVGSYFCIWRIA